MQIWLKSVSLLLELLGDLGGNSVHVGGSLLGKSLSVDDGWTIIVLVWELTNKASLLELDHAVSNAFSGGESVVLSAGSVVLVSRVVLSESVDSDLSSNVELIGNGGSSDVKPVSIIRSEILVASCLVVSSPLKELKIRIWIWIRNVVLKLVQT